MSWKSGADLAEKIWSAVVDHIPNEKRPHVALELVDIFEGQDCDTMMGTSLWELCHEPCPDCNPNFEGDDEDIENCKRCKGWGHVVKEGLEDG